MVNSNNRITLGFRISIYCEVCYNRDEDPSPILMLRTSGPFDARGPVGEVGDFYSCSRCKNNITVITQIDPGEVM